MKWGRIGSLIIVLVIISSMGLIYPAPAAADGIGDYFEISYTKTLSNSNVIGSTPFTLNVTATATCKIDLDFPLSSLLGMRVYGHIIGRNNATQATVELLSTRKIVDISNFPVTAGASYSDSKNLTLTFPAGTPEGVYTVVGEPGASGEVWFNTSITGWSKLKDIQSLLTPDQNALILSYATKEFGAVNYYPYSLNITSSQGTVTKNPDQPGYGAGDNVTLTANPTVGWSFSNWSGDLTGSASSASLVMTGNKSITANYTQKNYTLTINSDHGTVTRSPDQATYHYGDVVTLTPAASDGWSFSGWSGVSSSNGNTATVVITGDRTVTASFSQNTYILNTSVSPSPSAGSVTGSGTYHLNDPVQLTATANPGWTFSTWSGDVSGNATPVTLTIDGNKNITANFNQIEPPKEGCILKLTASPASGGIFETDKTPPYHGGDVVSVTANASPGYIFSGWSGAASGAINPLSITMDSDKNLTGNFLKIPYNLTLEAYPSGSGTFTYSQASPYYYGDMVIVTANATSGYSFSGWSGLNEKDGVSGDTATIIISGNRTLTANFAPNSYILTAAVSPSAAAGSISGGGTYHYQKSVSLNATANPGWIFSGWSSPDISISSNSTGVLNFLMPAQDITVTGNFSRPTGNITIKVALQNRNIGTDRYRIPVEVWLHTPGSAFTDAPLYDINNNSTDDQGSITLSGIETGIYDIRVKGRSTLINKQSDVTVSSNGTAINLGVLIDGDVNGDNFINSLDYSALVGPPTYYGISVTDPAAPSGIADFDFDGSGKVDAKDYNILVANYGQIGAY